MTEGSFTQTGVEEMRAAVNSLPDRVMAALRDVARATADRIRENARARLAAPSPPLKGVHPRGAADIADAITIAEDLPNKQIKIASASPRSTPANTVLWYEYGSIHQPARPYMHPAADDEEARYRADCESASASVAAEVFG